MKIPVYGHILKNITFDPSPHECGKTKDGVAFFESGKGWWAIDYKDFMRMAEAAKKVREKGAKQ